MRFTVEREPFLAALSFVSKYAASKDTIPILSQVRLVAADGSVSFTATDCERAATDTVPADVGAGGAICLPAALLVKTVKAGAGSEVSISSDGKQAKVLCGRSTTTIPVLPAADFPEMDMLSTVGDSNFDLPAATINGLASGVGFATFKAEGRWYLKGICWAINERVLEFCAIDGSKLSLLSVPAPIGVAFPQVIVPEFDIPAWDGNVAVALSDRFIRLASGRQALASKLIEGSFPDYHRVIPKNGLTALFDRAEMLSAIGRAALVADSREHSILFAGKDGTIEVSARTARGEVSDVVAYEGEDFRVAVASGVIAPILRSFDCETMEWRISDHSSPSTISDPNDATRVTVAMPYRDSRVMEGQFSEAAE